MRYDCFPFVRKRPVAPWDLLGIISQLNRQPHPLEEHKSMLSASEMKGSPFPEAPASRFLYLVITFVYTL